MLDKALEALKSFDWGKKFNELKPVTDAVVATHGDAAARKKLEDQLAPVLKTGASQSAKHFVCRQLMVIGTASSVPTLAALLPDKKLSHMARYALERIPAPEAGKALRDALPKLSGELKIGVIGSLGVRQDADSVSALGELVGYSDGKIARSAAIALGANRSAAAAKALTSTKPNAEAKSAVADASLACAESLLAAGKKSEALAAYKSVKGDHPKHVTLAVKRGMLKCLASK
jgi:HEAT repeat protein